MATKRRKFAGGGAMGAADSMGQSLNELRNSLDGIKGNLDGGSLGGNTPPSLGGLGSIFDKLGKGQDDFLQSQVMGQKDLGSMMGKLGVGQDATAYKKGGKVSSASKRGDGIATKGKTKGRFV